MGAHDLSERLGVANCGYLAASHHGIGRAMEGKRPIARATLGGILAVSGAAALAWMQTHTKQHHYQ